MIFEEIDDSQSTCLAANIGGSIVSEKAQIMSLCQRADDHNSIDVTVTVQGPFEYTPTFDIILDSGQEINFDNRVIGGIQIISPECLSAVGNSVTYTITASISSLLSGFEDIKSFHVRAKHLGKLDPDIFSSLVFSAVESINPQSIEKLTKGITPKPYKIYFDPITNKLKIQWTGLGSASCFCAINCVEPSEEDFNLLLCDEEIQEITIASNSIIGDPTNATLTFADTIGNQTKVQVHSMINVKPHKLSVIYDLEPARINVGVFYASEGLSPIKKDKVSYQIIKYRNSQGNSILWKDWSSQNWAMFTDIDIEPGNEYGYSIRFKGEFGDVSEFSRWAVVKT